MIKSLVDNLPRDKYNDTIVVFNALNGALPLALRERFPDSRIVCAEHFSYYNSHLERIGFEVVGANTLIKDKMKIDTIVGNPPFQEMRNGQRADQASNLWSKCWKLSFDITNDDATIALITPTTWLSPSADFKGRENYINGHDRLWDVFDSYTSYANVTDVAQHFPGVGSTFGYVIVDRSSHNGLTFSDGSSTDLGFLPRSNYDGVMKELSKVNNLASHFKINQSNTPGTRVSIPLTRSLTEDSIEILQGAGKPTKGSKKPGLYLYVHVPDYATAQAVRSRICACVPLLQNDCRWSGFVNIRSVKMIKFPG